MKDISISVLGGDERLCFLAIELAKKGYPIHTFGLYSRNPVFHSPMEDFFNIHTSDSLGSCVSYADVIIGPIPFSNCSDEICHTDANVSLPLTDFFSSLHAGQHLFGGIFSDTVLSYCQNHQIICHDFMKMETVCIENAIATAEGSLAEAIRMSSKTLHHAECLVLGFGRCGQILAERLNGLHARVRVCARNPIQRSKAYANGFYPVSFQDLKKELPHFDYIFNTIPFRVLTNSNISLLNKNACIIDIASAPGGTDFEACAAHGISAGLFLGLPGKYAPETSGKILADSVLLSLHESQ